MKVKSEKFITLQLSILYCLCFGLYLYVYEVAITEKYGYMGFRNDLSVANVPLAVGTILLCTFIVGSRNLPSVFFLHIALGIVIIPSMVLFCGANLPFEFYIITVIAFAITALVSKIIKIKRVDLGRINNLQLLKLLSLISFLVVVAIVALGGARFINFNLRAVYEFRGDAADNLPGVFGYINSAVGKVIIPFGVVIAALMRKWLYVALLSACAILLFGLTAHKSFLFYPFVVLFFYYISGKKNATLYFALSLIALGAVCLVDLYQIGDTVTNFIFRRAVLTPSLLNSFYIDWFSHNPFYYWSDSKLSFGLVDSPNELRSVNLIGLQFFGSDVMAANTGWIGSGYANAGAIGVYLYSLLMGLLLALLNSYSAKLGSRVVISFFIILALVLFVSTDLPTSLLTHGLLAALLLVSVMQPIAHKK